MPPGGIRAQDLSRRAAADLRLRPRGHWDRQVKLYTVSKNEYNYSPRQEIPPDYIRPGDSSTEEVRRMRLYEKT